jgi:hypothetical protein
VQVTLTMNGREVHVEVELGQHSCDTYLTKGFYLDTLQELTDDELDELQNNNQDAIAEYDMDVRGGWKD